MKMKQLFAVCGIAAALICGASAVSAQDNNGGGGGGGGGRGGFRGMDPEQMRQDYIVFVRNYLNFTNDADWSAVQPLVQKVLDSQREMGSAMGNGFRMFMQQRFADRMGGGGGGDQGGNNNNRRFRGRGMFGGGEPSPEYTALENAVDNNAPAGQIKNLLDRYTAAQKAKEDKLKAAQDSLRAVLDPGQEARATLLGMLN